MRRYDVALLFNSLKRVDVQMLAISVAEVVRIVTTHFPFCEIVSIVRDYTVHPLDVSDSKQKTNG
jgi:hypothetical protein